MEITNIITIGMGLIMVAALVGSMFYWAGRLASRMDALGERMDALGERMDALGERMDEQGQRLDEQGQRLDGRIDALGVEVATTRREIVAAISSHHHDTDGTITFRIPPPA